MHQSKDLKLINKNRSIGNRFFSWTFLLFELRLKSFKTSSAFFIDAERFLQFFVETFTVNTNFECIWTDVDTGRLISINSNKFNEWYGYMFIQYDNLFSDLSLSLDRWRDVDNLKEDEKKIKWKENNAQMHLFPYISWICLPITFKSILRMKKKKLWKKVRRTTLCSSNNNATLFVYYFYLQNIYSLHFFCCWFFEVVFAYNFVRLYVIMFMPILAIVSVRRIVFETFLLCLSFQRFFFTLWMSLVRLNTNIHVKTSFSVRNHSMLNSNSCYMRF